MMMMVMMMPVHTIYTSLSLFLSSQLTDCCLFPSDAFSLLCFLSFLLSIVVPVNPSPYADGVFVYVCVYE